VLDGIELAMSKAPRSEWRKTPDDILAAIKKTNAGVRLLQRLADGEQLHRKFTLDGRLVGDIGELVVFRSFKNIQTTKPRGHVHDLTARVNNKTVGVQVKVRRAGMAAKLEFKSRPEVLLALQFDYDWTRWRIVFNGSGAVLRERGVRMNRHRRFTRRGINTIVDMSLTALRDAHQSKKFSSPALKYNTR
jgi:hypothetical protein